METKGNIRKRRKERLKALSASNRAVDKQKKQAAGPASPLGQGAFAEQEKAFLQEGGYPLYSRYPVERDPEQVWKEKEEHMFSRSLLGQPLATANHKDTGQTRRPGRTFRLQLMASALIFVLVWGLFQFPHPVTEKARNGITRAVEREWNFAAISAWYESKFGAAPSFLPTFRSAGQPEASAAAAKQRQATLHTPAQATVAAPFSAKHPWLELQTAVGSPVAAMESGLVTLVSQQEGSGYTVTIRHTGGLESTYGLLAPIRLEQGDWVKSGETIGMAMKSTTTGKGTFTFALSQDGTYVNPAEWISFD